MNKYGTAAQNNVRNATVLDVQNEIKVKNIEEEKEKEKKEAKNK